MKHLEQVLKTLRDIKRDIESIIDEMPEKDRGNVYLALEGRIKGFESAIRITEGQLEQAKLEEMGTHD